MSEHKTAELHNCVHASMCIYISYALSRNFTQLCSYHQRCCAVYISYLRYTQMHIYNPLIPTSVSRQVLLATDMNYIINDCMQLHMYTLEAWHYAH
jgi:hypothetical protein